MYIYKGQWRGVLIFSLICAWTNGWVNNRGAGDLRRHHAHYDAIIMNGQCIWSSKIKTSFAHNVFQRRPILFHRARLFYRRPLCSISEWFGNLYVWYGRTDSREIWVRAEFRDIHHMITSLAPKGTKQAAVTMLTTKISMFSTQLRLPRYFLITFYQIKSFNMSTDIQPNLLAILALTVQLAPRPIFIDILKPEVPGAGFWGERRIPDLRCLDSIMHRDGLGR